MAMNGRVMLLLRLGANSNFNYKPFNFGFLSQSVKQAGFELTRPFSVCVVSQRLSSIASESKVAVADAVTFDAKDKPYSKKISEIVDQISQLTIVEVSQLTELLKSTLNIKDVPAYGMMPMQTAPPSFEDDSGEAKASVKTIFDVNISSVTPENKIKLIKEVKALGDGLNLVQSKKFVESLPGTLQRGLLKEDAEVLKAKLEAVGAVVEIV